MIGALIQKLCVCEDDIWIGCLMSGSNFKITSRLEAPQSLMFENPCVNMIKIPEHKAWK
jgi:hypothetical protein